MSVDITANMGTKLSLADRGAVMEVGRMDPVLAHASFGTKVAKPLSLAAMLGWLATGYLAELVLGISISIAATALIMRFGDVSKDTIANIANLAEGAQWIGYLAFVAVIALACRRWGWRAAEYFALKRPHGRYMMFGALALMVPLATIGLLTYCGFQPSEQGMVVPTTIIDLVVAVIATAVVAPLFEELMFRGFLYRTLAASRLGIVGTILITSLIWAGLHYPGKNLIGIAYLFLCGLLYGLLRRRSGSIVPTIAVHSLTNIVVSIGTWGITLGWWS
jgi:membrane protease YdiL (CAAX protease family)